MKSNFFKSMKKTVTSKKFLVGAVVFALCIVPTFAASSGESIVELDNWADKILELFQSSWVKAILLVALIVEAIGMVLAGQQGGGGQMIKKIGQMAREELNVILGEKVYLELFVRVEKDWRNRRAKLLQLNSLKHVVKLTKNRWEKNFLLKKENRCLIHLLKKNLLFRLLEKVELTFLTAQLTSISFRI